jgi:hypothetical protein
LLLTVTLPVHPNSMALDPQDRTLFVTVKNGQDVPAGSREGVASIRF